ncbi:MAG: hypothetical protein H7841_08455 [Magnetospirillum sp. WYHS-4]
MLAGEAAPPPERPAGGLDAELLGLVVEGVEALYKAESARLTRRDLGRLAARVHDDLVAAYDTAEERRIGLKLALEHLRRELRSAPVAPDQGKLSA